MIVKNQLGIYVHIPFCRKKCPYCDFYSVATTADVQANYVNAVISHMENTVGDFFADTLYFGGGTPNLLQPELLAKIIKKAREKFRLTGEITLEANPCEATLLQMQELFAAGFNRISFGMQSAIETELKMLGRRHSAKRASEAIGFARRAGFGNISVDVMIATPGQTLETLDKTIDFLSTLNVEHISAYMLKLEAGTAFDNDEVRDKLPDEDTVCEMYLHLVQRLESMGYIQYEISNFAKLGFESRHNLKYWRGEEYLAFGASAHGFLQGERYFYPRDLGEYISMQGENKCVEQTNVNALEEYIMLSLRLKSGMSMSVLREKYGVLDLKKLEGKAEEYVKYGLVLLDGDRISLTPKGFLLSNSLIVGFISEI